MGKSEVHGMVDEMVEQILQVAPDDQGQRIKLLTDALERLTDHLERAVASVAA